MFGPVHPGDTTEVFQARDFLPKQTLSAPGFDERLFFSFGHLTIFTNLLTFALFPFHNSAQFRQWRFRRFGNPNALDDSQ